MSKTSRVLSFLAVAALAAIGGCLQVEQATTLFPDGSGKIVIKMAIKKSMFKMMEGFATPPGGMDPADPDAPKAGKPEDPFAELSDVHKLAKNSEGIAAWKVGKKEEDGEWIRISCVGYFEDVNKVKIYNEKQQEEGGTKRELSFSARYEKTEEGHVLTVKDDTRKDLQDMPGLGGDKGAGEGAEAMGKAMLEMMKPLMQDLKVSVTVTVPGPIQEAQGFFEKKDRTATVSLDGKTIFEAAGNPEGETAKKMKSFSQVKESRITWKENQVPADEVEAFKKEMAEAREAWQKALDEAKKKPSKE